MRFETFERVNQHGRRWYFRGVGGNHEIVLPSQAYRSAAARDKTVAMVKREAGDAPVVPVKR